MKIIYFLSFLLSSAFSDAYAKRCREGFVEIDNNCYWISPNRVTVTWLEALEFCDIMNSTLLTITSDIENNVIRAVIKIGKGWGYWIGASDLQEEGTLLWVSTGKSEPVTYTDFAEKQPDNYGGIENCLELRRYYRHLWNDIRCDVKRGFICKYSP